MSEQTLETRVFKCMEALLQESCKNSEQIILKAIADRFHVKEQQVDLVLSKGLGLESDPVARLSDLISVGRKAALEKAETSKRTPAPETLGGPEGNMPPSPIDQLFAKAKQGEPLQ